MHCEGVSTLNSRWFGAVVLILFIDLCDNIGGVSGRSFNMILTIDSRLGNAIVSRSNHGNVFGSGDNNVMKLSYPDIHACLHASSLWDFPSLFALDPGYCSLGVPVVFFPRASVCSIGVWFWGFPHGTFALRVCLLLSPASLAFLLFLFICVHVCQSSFVFVRLPVGTPVSPCCVCQSCCVFLSACPPVCFGLCPSFSSLCLSLCLSLSRRLCVHLCHCLSVSLSFCQCPCLPASRGFSPSFCLYVGSSVGQAALCPRSRGSGPARLVDRVCLSVCQPVCRSVCQSFSPGVSTSVSPSVSLLVSLSFSPSLCLSVRLFPCQSCCVFCFRARASFPSCLLLAQGQAQTSVKIWHCKPCCACTCYK